MSDLLTAVCTAFDHARERSDSNWNAREADAHDCLRNELSLEVEPASVYWGGDVLRPYLAVLSAGEFTCVTEERSTLSVPRLIRELDEGLYGPCRQRCYTAREASIIVRQVVPSAALESRLHVPHVALLSLTNGARYQKRRYPLNIARLGQWLRFQHAARVDLFDLPLDFGNRATEMGLATIELKPDIVGISLNFGEINALSDVVRQLRALSIPPWLCLGNVLAAWAADSVRILCAGFQVYIASSYGESVLEDVSLAWTSTLSERSSNNTEIADIGAPPPAIVVPDERLLADTLSTGGQASLETSFGCQYSHCTFCPREHRGFTWSRPVQRDAIEVSAWMASAVKQSARGRATGVLSIVDEDAFGEEGRDPQIARPRVLDVVDAVMACGVQSEIYTRLEQIYDRGWVAEAAAARLDDLIARRAALSRIFVGVESGSDSQLRRYGKGQTVEDIAAALRAATLGGLSLEFGFITFDPLLTEVELADNLVFLARTDVLLEPEPFWCGADIVKSLRTRAADAFPSSGNPLFRRVAYMATELELFANSAAFRHLARAHPELVGAYDAGFARYDYAYQTPLIGDIARWCRVWTEGTFAPVYAARLASRTRAGDARDMESFVERVRHATFSLLLALAASKLESVRPRITGLLDTWRIPAIRDAETRPIGMADLHALWAWASAVPAARGLSRDVTFDAADLERRRAN